MATELPRYTAKLMGDAGSADLSLARSYESLSDTLFQFSQRVAGIVQKERAAQDKAFIAGVNADAIKESSRISNTVGTDYDLFQKEEEEFTNTYLENVPDHLKAAAKSKIVYQFAMKGTDVYKRYQKKINAEAINNKKVDIETYTNNLNETFGSYIESLSDGSIDIDSSASQFYTESLVDDFITMNEELDSLVTKHNMSPANKDKLRDEMKQNLLQGVFTSLIKVERDKGTDSKFMMDLLLDPDKFFAENYFMQLFPEDTITLEDRQKVIDFASSHIDDINKKLDREEKIADEELAKAQNNNYFGLIDQMITQPGSISYQQIDELWSKNELTAKQRADAKERIRNGEDFKDDTSFIYQLEQDFADPSMSKYMLKQKILNNQTKLSTDSMKEFLTRADKEVDELFERGLKIIYAEINQFADEQTNPLLRKLGFTGAENEVTRQMRRDVDELQDNIGVTIRTKNELLIEWDKIKARYKEAQKTQQVSTAKVWPANWPGTSDNHDINEVKEFLYAEFQNKSIDEATYMSQLEKLKQWQ